jgi:hypothetical protein
MAATALQRACGQLQLGFSTRSKLETKNLRQFPTLCWLSRRHPGYECRSELSVFRGRRGRQVIAQAVESSAAAPSESGTVAPQSDTPATENGTSEKKGRRRPGESKGFVEEMRIKAMKLHTRGQAKDGQAEEKKTEQKPLPQWKPTVEGYIQVRYKFPASALVCNCESQRVALMQCGETW